jgi:penicillin-binding protein 2
MKPLRRIGILFLLVFLAACTHSTGTATLPTPVVGVTPVPSVETAMRAFLDSQKVQDFNSMYAMLTQASRDSLSADDFSKRYTDDLLMMNVSGIDYGIRSTHTNPDNAQVAFNIVYHSTLFGDLSRDLLADFVLEGGQWHLTWDDGLILPELAGGKHLVTDYRAPARGDIYDRSGNAIVTHSDAVALGVVAGNVPSELQDSLFNALWRLTGVRPEIISQDYNGYGAGQYVPVGEASAEAVNQSGLLAIYPGLVMATDYTARFYYGGGVAPQTVGYATAIYKEDVQKYSQLGYGPYDIVGQTGIEAAYQPQLGGRDAATLYPASADGTLGNPIASVDALPADSLYLTIDRDLQMQAQQAMDGLPGAIVVMERDTGRILAMVSSPGFDPNLFDTDNTNSINLQNMVFSNPDQPLVNRAAQSAFPLGSVFKTVTMAAALESGLFTPESTWDCAYNYTELLSQGGPELFDWTWSHCNDAKANDPNASCNTINTRPSGLLTLPQGLMRSCDPWFYHIGFTLFNQGQPTAISDMAKKFGLGSPTGVGIAEKSGSIPDQPSDSTNATSQAIGQGGVLVTPLQVARFMAAIGNGGTLYKPQLVEKIQPVSGEAVSVFRPEAAGTLGLTPDNLKVIQDAMRSVTNDPRGTAYSVLGTFAIPTAAKTGTAESGTGTPHAWFAGYSLAGLPNKPDIAVAVVVNNQGEGAAWALPIFRRVMEIYFYGHPQYVYRWESNFGVLAAPTATQTLIPTP